MSYTLGRFEGRPLLAEMEDANRERTLRAFYIDRDDLVGLYDGIDSWIGQVGACCYKMNLADRIADYHAGRLSGEAPRRRKVIEDDDEVVVRRRPAARRRIHVD